MATNEVWRRALLLPTLCITNGGVQCKFVVLVFKQRSVSWDSDVKVGLSIPLRSIAKSS